MPEPQFCLGVNTTGLVPATVTLIHTHRFPHYFVTNAHRSGAGHVTTLIYILQSFRAYQSGTGLQLSSYTHREIFSLFCHQFPPVRYWSCDNSNIHITGFQSLPVWYWATVNLIQTHRFSHYFVTNSHRSGTGQVTTLIYILQGSRA